MLSEFAWHFKWQESIGTLAYETPFRLFTLRYEDGKEDSFRNILCFRYAWQCFVFKGRRNFWILPWPDPYNNWHGSICRLFSFLFHVNYTVQCVKLKNTYFTHFSLRPHATVFSLLQAFLFYIRYIEDSGPHPFPRAPRQAISWQPWCSSAEDSRQSDVWWSCWSNCSNYIVCFLFCFLIPCLLGIVCSTTVI